MIVNLNIVSKNLLFILVILYIAQGSIYSSGSMIGKLSLFVILGISVIYFIKCLKFKHDNPIFFYGWTTLFFLNMIGFFVGGIYDGTYYSQIRNISTAMLPFYPFYYFSKKNSLKPRDLLIFFYILIPISIMDYYSSLSTLLSDYDEEKIVNNSAYLFVALIPFIFLIAKRKILAMLTLLTLLFFIVESSKRGALIAAIFSTLIFIYHFIVTIDKKKKISNSIFIFAGLLFLLWYSYDLYINNTYLVSRFDNVTENTSNRNIIYSNIWNHWYNSNNFFNILFGYGFATTILYSGTGHLAHNDWLELLNNFGLLGIFIYSIVIIAAFRHIFYRETSRVSRLIILSIVTIWLLKTLFSMHYTNFYTIIMTILLAYVMGLHNRDNTFLK